MAAADPADVDLYALLGVAPGAGGDEIARAYRRRLRDVHPDTRDADAATGDDRAEVAALQHAYQTLRDPALRERYDAERHARTTEAPTPPPRPDPVRIPVRRRGRPVREPAIRVGPVRVDPLPPR